MYGHVADEGWMDGCAGELLRYRRAIGAEHIAVVVDVKKKHRYGKAKLIVERIESNCIKEVLNQRYSNRSLEVR